MSTGGVLRSVFELVLSYWDQREGESRARQDVAKSTGWRKRVATFPVRPWEKWGEKRNLSVEILDNYFQCLTVSHLPLKKESLRWAVLYFKKITSHHSLAASKPSALYQEKPRAINEPASRYLSPYSSSLFMNSSAAGLSFTALPIRIS